MLNIIKGSVADTLYLQLSESAIAHSVELHPDIILDLGESGTVVGIDFQNVAQLLADSQETREHPQPMPEIPATPSPATANPGFEPSRGTTEPGRLVYVPA